MLYTQDLQSKCISCKCRASLEASSAHLTNTCRLQRSAEVNGNANPPADAEQLVMLLSELPQVDSLTLHSSRRQKSCASATH